MPTYRESGCHIAVPKVQNQVGFVYICPGRHEERLGKPCAGQTGVMLESALLLLHAKKPEIFWSSERQHYLITNAWPHVEYKKKTHRSVPLVSEISSHENLERLYHEIKLLQYIVACGKLAHVAVDRCRKAFRLESVVAQVSHTSRPALGYPTNEDLPVRLDEWAYSVVKQF
jgi:hypothetical protein